MIQVYPAASRYSADHGWLQSNFSFSFAGYQDPDNMGFSVLRVFNDDVVQPSRGFGAHPHREMEIVSVVLKGQLMHQDSTGNKEVLRPGEVQRMSAGTGIVHSEMNPSDSEEASFLQLWFFPDEAGLTPSYEQTAYDQTKLRNQLLPVVSGRMKGEGIAHIHQDLTIYLSELGSDHEISFEQQSGRKIYVFVIEGSVMLNDEQLNRRDAARITEVTQLLIRANNGDAKLMLIDLP